MTICLHIHKAQQLWSFAQARQTPAANARAAPLQMYSNTNILSMTEIVENKIF